MRLRQNISFNNNKSDFDYAQSDSHSGRSRTVKLDGIKIFLFFILIAISGVANAQRIKATARLDSTNILLGDQIKLFLEIDHPKNVEIEFPHVPDSLNLGLIEVLSRSGIDTFELDNEELQKQIQSYTITCFDSGSYRIAPSWFKINIDGRIDSVPTNGVTLNVFTMQIDTTKWATDIKAPYPAPLTLPEVMPYILAIILIGAIIFLLLYSIKRKKNNKPIFARPKKPKEPAHIVAIRELDRIKTEKIWQKGKSKQYYSEVTEALRVYIEDRFEIPAMEQTSDETIESFRMNKSLLSDKLFIKVSQTLKLADLVKFAKYKPLPDDDSLSLTNAYTFVNETKKEKNEISEIDIEDEYSNDFSNKNEINSNDSKKQINIDDYKSMKSIEKNNLNLKVRIQDNYSHKKHWLKKWYILILLLLLIAVFTNPDRVAHQEAFKKTIDTIWDKKEKGFWESTLKSIGGSFILDFASTYVEVDDYIFFSITYFKIEDENYNIGFGAFGKVFIYEDYTKLKELVNEQKKILNN